MKPTYRMPGPLRTIVYLIIFLLLVLTLAALHVEPVVLAIITVAALVMLFSLEKKSAEYTPASVMQRAATLVLAAGGLPWGLYFPSRI